LDRIFCIILKLIHYNKEKIKHLTPIKNKDHLTKEAKISCILLLLERVLFTVGIDVDTRRRNRILPIFAKATHLTMGWVGLGWVGLGWVRLG